MPLPDSSRLYLNEHLSPRLAVQLRRYGFDVTLKTATSPWGCRVMADY